MQCEYFAIEGVAQLLNTIERVRDMLNPGLEIEGIALTMYDERMNLARQVAEEVRSHFGEKVYKTRHPAQRPPRRGAVVRQTDYPLRHSLARQRGLRQPRQGVHPARGERHLT